MLWYWLVIQHVFCFTRSTTLSRSWRCSWSSADRRCSNYIWVIDNFIAYQGASYIRDLTVICFVGVKLPAINWYIYIYSSWMLCWHCDNHSSANDLTLMETTKIGWCWATTNYDKCTQYAQYPGHSIAYGDACKCHSANERLLFISLVQVPNV